DESSDQGSIYIWNGFYEGEGGYRAGVNPFNGDREFYIQISDEFSSPPADGEWQVIFSGVGGLVDMWIANNTMDVVFNDGKEEQGTLAVPGTCKNAITVASFVSKLTWRDFDNNNLTFDSKGIIKEGQLSPFSSRGPVRNGGYLKPEIAAPGQILVSVYSSSASAFEPYSIFYSGDTRYPNALINQDGDHGLSSGTSMAAPHVTGAIALLFEQNPALTVQQIKEMLFASTTKDAFVGSVPNTDWGWGKLDVLRALSIAPVDDTPREFLLLPARPNPFSNQTEIIYEIPSLTDAGVVELAIYNSIGQKVRTLLNERKSAGSHNIFWDGRTDQGEAAGSGVYFLRLQMDSWKSVEKVVYLGSF
ncbi:MAG: T9SS C-terminal target domain-containing protein, partial [Calditrichaeota bacterium]